MSCDWLSDLSSGLKIVYDGNDFYADFFPSKKKATVIKYFLHTVIIEKYIILVVLDLRAFL